VPAEPGGLADSLARLRLARTRGIGPVTFRQLLQRFGDAASALAAIPDLARRGGGKPPQIATADSAEAEIDAVARMGGRHLFVGQGLYPSILAQIDTAPPVLIARGRLALLEEPALAIVGARNASAAARRFARGLSLDLSREGQVIVSGLARGIDSEAHVGALEGGTIAVVAGGADIHYPPENARLQEEIAERGLVLAEQPPGREPQARHFPYRNRIIAGLTLGTIVVEAAPRSGSLITARQAGEFGREVMAVPGSPLDPRAQGCNQLIRDGATLVQSADDVMASLRPFDPSRLAEPAARYRAEPIAPDIAAGERKTVTALLGPVPVPVDELVRQSGLAAPLVQTALLELELAGKLERHAGGKVSLA